MLERVRNYKMRKFERPSEANYKEDPYINTHQINTHHLQLTSSDGVSYSDPLPNYLNPMKTRMEDPLVSWQQVRYNIRRVYRLGHELMQSNLREKWKKVNIHL